MDTGIRKEALKRLEELRYSTDTESAHSTADAILCELLELLGYEDIVMAYEAIDKWYA